MSDKIIENQAAFDAKVKRIREDADLSRDAKRRYLGEAFAVARDEHERLVAEHREQSQKKINEARKSVMSIKCPKQMLEADQEIARMSNRDAYDRAEKAAKLLRREPTGMTDLLERAELSGDGLLAQAIFHVATRKGLRGVNEAYLQTRPTDAAAWQKLADAQAEAGSADSQLYGWVAPRKPPELLGAAAPGERLDEIGRDRPAPAAAASSRSEARAGVSHGYTYPSRTPADDA